ncbi:hypothetical protein CASP1_00007 [Alcaligenes phage CASP1]|nr:hypothetical protein CASP1_00007 [Alcaligenes phage CASP1]
MSKVTMPEPIGVASGMPAASGFTMVCFSSADVPVGEQVFHQNRWNPTPPPRCASPRSGGLSRLRRRMGLKLSDGMVNS